MENQVTTHSKFRFIKYLLLIISILFCIEIVHLFLAFRSVETATNFATRYAVLGEFDPVYCEESCQQGSADARQAQLLSIQNAAYLGFRKLTGNFFIWDIDQANLRLSVCSDREGIYFNRETTACSPYDDPGEYGGLVFINTSYPYIIGSSLGLNLGNLLLKSSTESQNECFKLGCWSVIKVSLLGNVPDQYVIEISATDGRYRLIECANGLVIRSEGPQYQGQARCRGDGAEFDFDPARVEVSISWKGGEISQSMQPLYHIFRPNGFRCSPTCLISEVEIYID